MNSTRVVATRSTLLRSRVQLDYVRRGADALNRKRRALVSHLFRAAKPAIDSRAEIARLTTEATAALHEALAVQGLDALRMLGARRDAMNVEITPVQIWGVAVADVTPATAVHRTLDARGTPPGSTGREAIAAADAFEALVERLIASAANEVRVGRLAAAVAATSQQLRMLRDRVEPRLLSDIATVARTLEERERDEHSRLKHLQRLYR